MRDHDFHGHAQGLGWPTGVKFKIYHHVKQICDSSRGHGNIQLLTSISVDMRIYLPEKVNVTFKDR